MIVGDVSLRDVRSYPALELALEPGLVLVTGPNGAGKTNLLEAVHLATQGLSFRTRHDAQIVRNGAAEGRVSARGVRGTVGVRAEVTLSRTAPKRIRLDGAAVGYGVVRLIADGYWFLDLNGNGKLDPFRVAALEHRIESRQPLEIS